MARWQAERLDAGAGPHSVHAAARLLGTILQRAFQAGRIGSNPVRQVDKVRRPKSREVRPLAPATVEKMRAHARASARWPLYGHRDAVLLSVLAYAGLRPGEALALRWGDIREQTILVERAMALGEVGETKTGHHRTVRLLAPLRADLREFQLASGRPEDDALVFRARPGSPTGTGEAPWTLAAYQSWRRKVFARCLDAAGIAHARPYDLRHSFASLLLHEGRSVIYVARQLGHDAQLTLSRYGHVIDELEDAPNVAAELAVRAAREGAVPVAYPNAAEAGSAG